jgi:hypothetical protein
MKSSLLGRWQLALHIFTITSLAGAISSGCARSYEPGPVPPLPDGCPPNAPPSNTTQLRACLAVLDFDPLEAAGDEQRLTIFDTASGSPGSPCPPGVPDAVRSCRHGPLAVIQPEINSYRYSYNDLKSGRIIAKLFLRKDEKEPYEKLGLQPGDTTYWWVQKIPGQPDNNAGRSVYITVTKQGSGGLLAKNYALQYVPHEGKFKQALARWVWDPTDEKTQGSCSQGCCR